MLSQDKVAALSMAEVMLDSEEGAISVSALRGALRRLTEVLAHEKEAEPPRSILIPPIGSDIVLTEDWRFTLVDESRNDDAYALVSGGEKGDPYRFSRPRMPDLSVILQKGTVLRVDRLYVRKPASDFDSITFMVMKSPRPEWTPKSAGGTRQGKFRFWAKLAEVNTMVGNVVLPKID